MKKFSSTFKAVGLFALLSLSFIPAALFFICITLNAQTWQQVPIRTQFQKDA